MKKIAPLALVIAALASAPSALANTSPAAAARALLESSSPFTLEGKSVSQNGVVLGGFNVKAALPGTPNWRLYQTVRVARSTGNLVVAVGAPNKTTFSPAGSNSYEATSKYAPGSAETATIAYSTDRSIDPLTGQTKIRNLTTLTVTFHCIKKVKKAKVDFATTYTLLLAEKF